MTSPSPSDPARHFRSLGAALACLLLGPLTAAAQTPAAPAAEDPAPLILEVELNGTSTGRVGEFVQRPDGGIAASAETWNEVGIAVPTAATGLIPASAIPGLVAELDSAASVLRLRAEDAARQATRLGETPFRMPVTRPTRGVVLNYDVLATHVQRQGYGSGVFELRGFGPEGVLTSSALYNSAASGREAHARRLDSTYVWSDPEALQRLRIGDIVTGSLRWGRALRLGGAQWFSDFSLQPGLVTFPTPSIRANAAVGSSVDLLVNGIRQFSQPVGGGPFEVSRAPIVSGSGQLAVVVRDPLGRETVTSIPFYTSPSLLQPGLTAFSAQAGPVRLGYASADDRYQGVVGTATLRRGITDWLTLEAQAEGTEGAGMAGAGAVVKIGTLGVVSLAVAGSLGRPTAFTRQTILRNTDPTFTTSGGSAFVVQSNLRDLAGPGRGFLASFGLERIARGFSLAGEVTVTSASFTDAAGRFGDLLPRLETRASLGVPLPGEFSASATWTQRRYGAAAPKLAAIPGLTTSTGSDISLLTGSITRSLGEGAFLFATAFHEQKARTTGVQLGLTLLLGADGRTSASAIGSRDRTGWGATAEAQRNATAVGEIGWRLRAQHQWPAPDGTQPARTRLTGQGEWLTQQAQLTLGADHGEAGAAFRAGARGAVTLAGGGLFLSDRVSDSFAIVRTGDVGGVPILAENRPAGVTDSSGRLMIPTLRAWQTNTLAIDALGLPADIDAGDMVRRVAPPDRSGVLVEFAVSRGNAARLLIVEATTGRPVPVGSTLRLIATGAEQTVGHGGESYLTGLAPENAGEVTRPNGTRCQVDFAFSPVAQDIPVIGPVPCR